VGGCKKKRENGKERVEVLRKMNSARNCRNFGSNLKQNKQKLF
jgi:hypothetical protein